MMMMIYYDVDCKIRFETSSKNAHSSLNPFSVPTPTGINILHPHYWDLDLASLKTRPFAQVASGVSTR